MFRRLGSVDHLKDFDPNDDTIVLSAAHFGLKAGNLASERFSDGASLPAAEARIIHDPVTGKLFLDRTGGDSGDAVLFAKLKPGLALDAEDFFVAWREWRENRHADGRRRLRLACRRPAAQNPAPVKFFGAGEITPRVARSIW